MLLPFAFLALIGLAVPAWGQSTSSCLGDCNGDGRVTVADIIVIVNIVLGQLPDAACTAGLPPCVGGGPSAVICDYPVGIQLINEALNGCPPPPTQRQTSHTHS